MSFEIVVLFLINELLVRAARDDWEAVIEDTLGRFRTYSTVGVVVILGRRRRGLRAHGGWNGATSGT